MNKHIFSENRKKDARLAKTYERQTRNKNSPSAQHRSLAFPGRNQRSLNRQSPTPPPPDWQWQHGNMLIWHQTSPDDVLLHFGFFNFHANLGPNSLLLSTSTQSTRTVCSTISIIIIINIIIMSVCCMLVSLFCINHAVCGQYGQKWTSFHHWFLSPGSDDSINLFAALLVVWSRSHPVNLSPTKTPSFQSQAAKAKCERGLVGIGWLAFFVESKLKFICI